MTVYIEIVFIENLTVDYFILMLCARLTHSKARHPWCASLFGALYACVMPMWSGFQGFGAKILSLMGTVLICFCTRKYENARNEGALSFSLREIKTVISQMLAAVAVTGMLYGLTTLADSRLTENGMIYSGDSLMLVSLLCILLSFSLYRAGTYLMQKKHLNENTAMFSVCGITVEAFVDSGNALYYNGIPVVLVERSAMSGQDTKIPVVIPYSTVGNNGALLGFRANDAAITYCNKTVEVDCIVALCDRDFGKSFRALLHPDLIRESV